MNVKMLLDLNYFGGVDLVIYAPPNLVNRVKGIENMKDIFLNCALICYCNSELLQQLAVLLIMMMMTIIINSTLLKERKKKKVL